MTSMSKTLRVLHVEDSEQDMALIARHLKRAGYELISERVETAETMKTMLGSREWDVVLCDYSMPWRSKRCEPERMTISSKPTWLVLFR